MTPTPDSFQSPHKIIVPGSLGVGCIWTVRERGLVVARAKNIFTNFGLTALASAVSGGYTPPLYLVIDSAGTTLSQNYNAGATSINLQQRVDISGDTQLVLNPGGVTQETVTFSGTPTGAGPYTYALTAATTQNHNGGEVVVRQTNVNDTLSTVVSEVQYDSVGAPNQRVMSVSGYSQGNGIWVLQFYITGQQALAVFNTVGIADNLTLGQGNLHDHAVLGYNHTANNDVEIDVTITLVNN